MSNTNNVRLTYKTSFPQLDIAYNDPETQEYLYPAVVDTNSTPALVKSYYKGRELSHMEMDLNFRAIEESLHNLSTSLASVSGGTVSQAASYPGKQFFHRG